ncbi:hypothetical protein CH063_04849, partial [Colletotrichum higginsianum]
MGRRGGINRASTPPPFRLSNQLGGLQWLMAAGCKLPCVWRVCDGRWGGLMAVDPPSLDRVGGYELNIVILTFGRSDRLRI